MPTAPVAPSLAVLIVEDNPDDHTLVRAALRGLGATVSDRRVDNPEELKAALESNTWDVVVSDHRLPRMSSRDALRIVRAHDPTLPFVIVSGELAAQAAVLAMQAGADGYVGKDHLDSLAPAVTRALEAAALRRRERDAAAALARSEGRLRTLAANLPGIVLQFRWHDGRLEFTYASDGASRMLGLDPARLQQDSEAWFDAMPEDQAWSLRTRLEEAVLRGSELRWAGCIHRSDGQLVWIEIAASQREIEPGEIGWDAIVSDITAQKAAEAALVQSREELRTLTAHLAVVREQERERIARELHDEVGSTLTALKIELALVRNAIKSPSALLAPLQRAGQLLESAIMVSTRIMHDLRPGILDQGLIAALEWQARSFEQRMGLACDFTSSHEDIPLSREQSITLFRICQEALNNVAKHAQARSVSVRLNAGDGSLTMQISDDGRGISKADLARSDRFGLRGMRERADALGGSVSIEPREGGGSRVTVVLPLAPEEVGADEALQPE
ncbi:MAG TPA: ATP-binding protein [Casimicrobiaceae bacterium]|nr:ATP-binding protein [Casimicrobiaceae bacterium]